jgi:phosphoribosylformylglycinamidine synthase, purS protein
MKAQIHVTLKNGVLDPQGEAISKSLGNLGFANINSIKQGKFFEIDIAETDKKKAEQQLHNICEKLLANTVIEDFKFELL